jgi:hypothetical protein
MFDSIYSSSVTASEFFLMAGVAIASGLLFAWIMSRRVRATKRFFIVASLIPFVVGAVVTFVNGSIGAGVAVGGAFSLIRFRSAQGTSDEIAAILIAMGAGIAFGMGYLAYGVIILLTLAALYFLFASLHLFDSKPLKEERLLKVTVPESLEYTDMFDEPFKRYLKSVERLGVKTTGMGSMFRLSFLVRMKDPNEEKAFIDELRTRNGNLEISLLPYSEQQAQL